MVTNYKRGYALEHKTKKILEEKGWFVVRSPASKTPTDIYATKNGENLFVQCKKTTKDKTYITGLKEIIKQAREYKATPLIAYSFQRTPVYAQEITDDKISLDKKAKNTTLKKYLEIKEIEQNKDYDNSMIIT